MKRALRFLISTEAVYIIGVIIGYIICGPEDVIEVSVALLAFGLVSAAMIEIYVFGEETQETQETKEKK